LDAARDYYDELVEWWDGTAHTTAKRWETNYALDYRKPATEHLQALLDGARSVLFLSGGKFVLRPIKAESSVFSFDESNIAVGDDGESLLEAELVDRSSRANRIVASFHSADTLQSETEAAVDDEDDQEKRVARIGNGGVAEQQLKLAAVTNAAQAQRAAESILAQQVGSRWVYRLTTTVKGLALQPGDVVDLTHPCVAGTAIGTVDSIDHDELDRLVVTVTEYVEGSIV
jgi:predicted phage tail protein